MQSAQVVTVKSGQQNAFSVDSKSPMHSFELRTSSTLPREFYFLNQPGQIEIQSDLFYDYRTNVENYPRWQAWMREKQPRLLVIWGKYDPSFDISEPEAYRRDVPDAEVHVLDGGHFALDTKADEIAALVGQFMRRQK